MIKTWYIIGAENRFIDADAQAFLTAAGITNTNIIEAINDLVVGLKANNLWAKMFAIYPFTGGTLNSNKLNLKNPADTNAAFRLSFVNSWSHTLSGSQPTNPSASYANTFLMPSAVQNVNSNGFGIYITANTLTSADPCPIGSYITATQASSMGVSNTAIFSRLNATSINGSITGGQGSFDAHKTSATLTQVFKNGILVAQGNSGGTLPVQNIFLGTLNINGNPYTSGWVNCTFRFAYISQGLQSTEVATLRNIVQTYQTKLGREI